MAVFGHVHRDLSLHCENFEYQFLIDSLINMMKCFSRISEPAENLGIDRHDNLIFD